MRIATVFVVLAAVASAAAEALAPNEKASQGVARYGTPISKSVPIIVTS